MSRLDDLKTIWNDKDGKSYIDDFFYAEDIDYLIRIAESAKLPDEHDIDNLVWCQGFIGRIQEMIEGSENG